MKRAIRSRAGTCNNLWGRACQRSGVDSVTGTRLGKNEGALGGKGPLNQADRC